MKLEVNIEKRYIILMTVIIVLGVLVMFVNAVPNYNLPYHAWSQIDNIPAGFADGIDNGIITETDPTINWETLKSRGMPFDFQDGIDDTVPSQHVLMKTSDGMGSFLLIRYMEELVLISGTHRCYFRISSGIPQMRSTYSNTCDTGWVDLNPSAPSKVTCSVGHPTCSIGYNELIMGINGVFTASRQIAGSNYLDNDYFLRA